MTPDLEAIRARQKARHDMRRIDAEYVKAHAPHVVAVDVGGDQVMDDIDALLAEVEDLRDHMAVVHSCNGCRALVPDAAIRRERWVKENNA